MFDYGDHIKSHDSLSKHQWRFRKLHSTEELLLHQTECWHKELDKGKTIAVLFVDYHKAFDSVSHKTALLKLASLGFSGDILQYLSNYLSKRKEFTVVNESLSSESNVNYGAPQGSLLGTVCFLGSVNDLPEEAQNENGETNLFADDSTTFEIGNTVDYAISKIKKTAKHIECYSNNNSQV